MTADELLGLIRDELTHAGLTVIPPETALGAANDRAGVELEADEDGVRVTWKPGPALRKGGMVALR